jgi:hypothetical protein
MIWALLRSLTVSADHNQFAVSMLQCMAVLQIRWQLAHSPNELSLLLLCHAAACMAVFFPSPLLLLLCFLFYSSQ